MTLNQKLNQLTDEDILDAISEYGSANSAANALGIPRSTFKDRAKAIMDARYVSKVSPKPEFIDAPYNGGVKRWIFTSAQDGTEIDLNFLRNLEVYAEYVGAEIQVSGYTYASVGSKDRGQYHPKIRMYLTGHPLNVADKLVWCAETNILPTATDPLSGFEAYTRSKWGVFPHPRVSLKSIPVVWHAQPKLIMTTGTLSKPNYQPKKAGLKAEFHHVIGAVLVEIDAEGDIFCRHLIAEKDGSFQDLTTRVHRGAVVANSASVEAITWGDTHPERLDPEVAFGAWGVDALLNKTSTSNMLDILRPTYQFFHDALDMRRRNHHSINDPHKRFEDWVQTTDSVAEEVYKSAAFLEATSRPWCASVVVDSNHDRALMRWLKTADYRTDPANALYFLTLQKAVYEAVAQGNNDFLLAEFAFRHTGCKLDRVSFLKNTDSFMICHHAGGGIECAMHGDLGANGAPGSLNAFARMGPKANVAHTHSAAIFEGIYVAGHSCMRDMVYNRGGLTSWSPSHIITYPSGKRTIITMQGSKFCA